MIDVKQYTFEELILIRAAVDAEINDRCLLKTSTLVYGKYTVGIDIAPGDYILVGIMDKGPSGFTPSVYLLTEYGTVIDWEYIATGKKWGVSLEDGMVVEVNNGDCAIQKRAPFEFAPD